MAVQQKFLFEHLYRVVDNDPDMVDAVRDVAGDSYIETPPYMLAEDFSMYQKRDPWCLFLCRDSG